MEENREQPESTADPLPSAEYDTVAKMLLETARTILSGTALGLRMLRRSRFLKQNNPLSSGTVPIVLYTRTFAARK